MSQIKIFTDGGSRGNPGPAACAFVAFDYSNKEIFSKGEYLGIKTNNVAEYAAVILAFNWLSDKDYEAVNFFIDSELVVKQLNGIYKIKNQGLSKLAMRVMTQKREYKGTIKFTHVLREKNKEADLLVNQTLDSHGQSA